MQLVKRAHVFSLIIVGLAVGLVLLVGLFGVLYVLPAAQPSGAIQTWTQLPTATQDHLRLLILGWLILGFALISVCALVCAVPARWFLGGAWSRSRVLWAACFGGGMVGAYMVLPWTAMGAGLQHVLGSVVVSATARAFGFIYVIGAAVALIAAMVAAVSIAQRTQRTC